LLLEFSVSKFYWWVLLEVHLEFIIVNLILKLIPIGKE
jgi:hypothetical protein